MNSIFRPLTTLGCALVLLGSLGCERKISAEAQAAQEAAKAADARVAALELQIADLAAGKHQPIQADRATAEQVAKSQTRALERQLADMRRSAEAKHRSAREIAADRPPEAPAAKRVSLDVPEGTRLTVRLREELSTSTVQPGDTWDGTLSEDIVVAGTVAWTAGTQVRGIVTQSLATGRLSSGQGNLGIKVTALGHDDVDTNAYVVVGDKRGGRNARIIGGGAALGALIGILSNSNNQQDHALGGAAIGAAAGTAAAAGSADTVIRIPADRAIPFTLAAPERISRKL
jgi:hypothetical protein